MSQLLGKVSAGKWRFVTVFFILLAMAGLAWLLTPSGNSASSRNRRSQNSGPMPVVSGVVSKGDMPIVINGLGTVTPLATVTVQSQIAGQITRIAFKEGQTVKANDFLIQIDPRPYQVAQEQAEGALARDRALLENAKIDLARYQTLYTQDSVAEQQLATQKALVAQYDGTVKTDQAQLDSAKLNLEYCHIESPIDGRVGLQQVNIGNYITPGEPSGLVVVTQLKPITVVFSLPEDQIPDLVKQMNAGQALQVLAYDRSHTTRLATGTLQSIDNQIDTTTGTVKLKASFANDDGSLFPNQFVNVDLLLNTLHDATLIPQSAVQRGTPGTYVYLVNADSTVNLRKVDLGPGDATNVVVSGGLRPGDTVVTDGADRLKDGAKVLLPQNQPAPQSSLSPKQHAHAGNGDGTSGQHHHHRDGNASNDNGSAPAQQ